MQIALKDITIKDRGRKKYEKIDELAASLAERGQLQEVVVRPPREGEDVKTPWVLVAGGRRMTAALKLGWTEIRAHSTADMADWVAKVLELEENIQREDMTWDEIAEMRLQIHELYQAHNPEWNQEKTARKIGASTAQLSKDIEIAKEIRKNPELKKASSKKAATNYVKVQQTARAKKLQQKQIDYVKLDSHIVTADMRNYVRTIESQSVDLTFCDWPYGIDFYERQETDQAAAGISEYDDSRENALDLLVDMVPQMIRITKSNGWVAIFTGFELFLEFQKHFSNCCAEHFEYRANPKDANCPRGTGSSPCRWLTPEAKPWIWFRPNSRNQPRYPQLHAMNFYEDIFICNMGEGVLFTDKGLSNVLVCDADYTDRVHAMQKPVEVCEEIIRRLTTPGDLVVDLCFGSGSALVGAYKLGRNAKGCDLNPMNKDSAVARVAPYFSTKRASGETPAPATPAPSVDVPELTEEEMAEWVEPT